MDLPTKTLPSTDNLSSLCERLRSERLLVSSELDNLKNLNVSVDSELSDLGRLEWGCRQEQLILHRLINSHASVSRDNCCRLISGINSAHFLEAYRVIGHHASGFSQILTLLLQSPRSVAEFLDAVDQNIKDLVHPVDELNRAIFNVLYGSCIFPSDEKLMLDLLAHLITLQLVTSKDPRKVLRKGNTAFSRLYHLFSEELFSAKIFLTAALHEPIMYLLSQDELFLDIDPSKSVIRFPIDERRRRFGADENSHLYKEKVAAFRRIIVDKLANIGEKFVKAIQQAMSCFPSSLTWLVRQLHTALLERKRVSNGEAALICTDLIFTYFLCPAITNPEPLGIISDTPISYIARFNLMQIGQVLQTLALLPYEQPSSQFSDLLCRFDQAAMPQIVTTILNSSMLSLETMFSNVLTDSEKIELYARRACIGSLYEVNILHVYLQTESVENISDISTKDKIKSLVKKMPKEFSVTLNQGHTSSPSTDFGSTPPRGIPLRPSSSSGRLKNFADKVQNAAARGHQRFMRHSPSRSAGLENQNPSENGEKDVQEEIDDAHFEVLIFPFGEERIPHGLEPEEKIMQSFRPPHRKHKISDGATEKKTRFMATAEEDRTTNEPPSDDDEVEVEAAGSSPCSSIDDQVEDDVHNLEDVDEDDDEGEDVSTLPDNFSDVVPISANVSGRGSPSLSGEGEPNSGSGRGTPFSGNAQEQPDPVEAAAVSSTIAGAASNTPRPNPLPNVPVTVRRQNPEGLEEKFGKFGLPPRDPSSRYRDETYSLVSDSWSTDVVASDNEGASERDRHDHGQNLPMGQNLAPPLGVGQMPVLPEAEPQAQVDAQQPPADPVHNPQRLGANLPRGPRNLSGNFQPAPSAANAANLQVGISEDRSDTWSLDATASDSEADALAARGNDVDLMLMDDLVPSSSTSSASALGGTGPRRTVAATLSNSSSLLGESGFSNALTRRKGSQPTSDLNALPEYDALASIPVTTSTSNSAKILLSNQVQIEPRDRIRRQSSGSSFYSKSDVSSEFSKELTEDPLMSAATNDPLIEPQAGSSHTQRSNPASIPNLTTFTISSNPNSPIKKTTFVTEPHRERTATVISKNTPEASQTPSDPLYASVLKPTGAAVGEMAIGQNQTPNQTRRLDRIQQGLQKIGANLKRNTAISFRQNMPHSSTIGDFVGPSGLGTSSSTSTTPKPVPSKPISQANRLTESCSVGNIIDITNEPALSTPANAAEDRQRVADDILNKYRAIPTMSETTQSAFQVQQMPLNHVPELSQVFRENEPTNEQPYYDPTNVTQCKAFIDAKRKLRLVLSSAANVCSTTKAAGNTPTTMETVGVMINGGSARSLQLRSILNGSSGDDQDRSTLLEFLKLLLAESINSQDKTLSAQIREVQRCLAVFDNKAIRKLLRTLKDEHRKRTSYLLYLQQSRLTLLQLKSYLVKLNNRIKREKSLTSECLVEVLVRFYLEKKDQFLRRFIRDFAHLNVQDEKTDAVDRALRYLYERMGSEPMWQCATEENLSYAKKSLERSIMGQIYIYALYPNGDADQCRDEVFFKSLQSLASTITPDHHELRIPKRYHGECPWPSAQAEIAIINAYKSPSDKIGCIVRCCETIANLIVLSSDHGTASADDITPVLVYVLLQANPPALLSNIQYIQGFYASRMQGEEAYWWTQFTAAVEFLKQLLNKHLLM